MSTRRCTSLLDPDFIEVFVVRFRLAYANPFVRLLKLLEDDFLVSATAAIERGHTWVVDYEISLNPSMGHPRCRHQQPYRVGDPLYDSRSQRPRPVESRRQSRSSTGRCLDVALEASAFTNALPVHRLQLAAGDRSDAPAAYVGALDVTVERLEQTYVHTGDDGTRLHFEHTTPMFGFACELIYDMSGLLLAYPGIATRAG